jgi:hypothetical protein
LRHSEAQCRASGYLLPEPVLHRQVNLFVEPPVLLAEFRGELVELEQLNLITMIAGSLGGPRKIRLTDAGRAEVAANA